MPGQVPPVQPGPSERFPGFDSNASSNDSEEPSHIIPRISVRVGIFENILILVHRLRPKRAPPHGVQALTLTLTLNAKCKNLFYSACDGWDLLKSLRARTKRKGSHHTKIRLEFR